MACEVFIELNGGTLEANDLELYPQYLGLADGTIDEAEFARWLRARVITQAGSGVQEPAAAYR
ncbi:hypothetical protein [Thauera sp. SDU_THAU2]|uniref:hypothetical protein n=1 Tax=Thauera sp. SDU_THAU2 TaxID=3136633 RepID=UPI00311E5AF3